MATKSKKTVTETNAQKLVKTAPKWWDSYRGATDGKVNKEVDAMDTFWMTYYEVIKTLNKKELHGLLCSVRDKIEDRTEQEIAREFKQMNKKQMLDTVLYQSADQFSCLALTEYMVKIVKDLEERFSKNVKFGKEAKTPQEINGEVDVLLKNMDYEALLNDAELEDIKVKNQRQGKEIAEALKTEVVSTNPRKTGPVTKIVQDEINATVAYVNARHSDDPTVKEAVKEYEAEMVQEAKDAGALLGQGRVNRTGLNKNGSKSKRKVGVITTIAEILLQTSKPLTKDDILNTLMDRFPERLSSAMETTVNCQVPARMSREKGMDIVQVDCGTNGLTGRTIWGYMVNSDLVECVDEVNGYYELK